MSDQPTPEPVEPTEPHLISEEELDKIQVVDLAWPTFDDEDLNNRFDYHRPTADKARTHEGVRASHKLLAYRIVAECPPSRERDLALERIEEAMMWANAAIARNDE